MSDDDIQTAQERRAGETKHRAAVAKLHQQWRQEGYDPRAHEIGIRLDGDEVVVQDFKTREHATLRERRDICAYLRYYGANATGRNWRKSAVASTLPVGGYREHS